MVNILFRRDILSILFAVFLLFVTRIYLFPGDHILPNQKFTPLFFKIFYWPDWQKGWQFAMSLILIVGQGLLINLFCERHGLMQSKTWMPGFLYWLIMSFYPWQHALQPNLFVQIFLLILMHFMALLYEKEQRIEQRLMDLGLLFCFLPLLSVEGWYFLIFLLISISFFIFYNIQRLFLLLLSMALPVFLFVGFSYFVDDMSLIFFPPGPGVDMLNTEQLVAQRAVLGPYGYILMLSLAGMIMIRGKMGSFPSKVRKVYLMFFVLFVIELLMVIFSRRNFFSNISLLALPLSIFAGYLFVQIRLNWVRECLFAALLVAIIASQLLFKHYLYP